MKLLFPEIFGDWILLIQDNVFIPMLTLNGRKWTSLAWKRERRGGSSGFPLYLGTGRPRAMTRKSSLTRTIFQLSSSSMVCSCNVSDSCHYVHFQLKQQNQEHKLTYRLFVVLFCFLLWYFGTRVCKTDKHFIQINNNMK